MIKDERIEEIWPRTKAGDPIFTCSEDAIYYAHIIFKNEQERLKIARLREHIFFSLADMRKNSNPDLNRMMQLAVKGQFYRECLEEVQRINDWKFELPGGA